MNPQKMQVYFNGYP